MDTHFGPLTDTEIDEIRARHVRAEHRAEEEADFAASNAHQDRGFLLDEVLRLRALVRAATVGPGLASVAAAPLRRAG